MKEKFYKVGDVFETTYGGPVVVIDIESSLKVTVEFVSSGYRKIIQASKLKSGNIKDDSLPTVCGFGYNNDGKYPSSEMTEKGLRNTTAYSTWSGMIKRCYDEGRRHKAPTYLGCSVDSVWSYYQNYAEFYYEDPWRKDGWHLEKDLLVKGNKVYGPTTCVFAPREINALANKMENRRGEWPIGVHYKKANKRYGATYRDGAGKLIHIGYFSNPNDAFYAFKNKKECLAKEIAEAWKGQIDPRLYEALCNYTVEIDD